MAASWIGTYESGSWSTHFAKSNGWNPGTYIYDSSVHKFTDAGICYKLRWEGPHNGVAGRKFTMKGLILRDDGTNFLLIDETPEIVDFDVDLGYRDMEFNGGAGTAVQAGDYFAFAYKKGTGTQSWMDFKWWTSSTVYDRQFRQDANFGIASYVTGNTLKSAWTTEASPAFPFVFVWAAYFDIPSTGASGGTKMLLGM